MSALASTYHTGTTAGSAPDARGLSCTMLLQQFHNIPASVPGRPCHRSGPRFVAGQIDRGAAFEQELDHSPSALRLIRINFSAPGTNGRGQGRPLEFDLKGVNVGPGVK